MRILRTITMSFCLLGLSFTPTTKTHAAAAGVVAIAGGAAAGAIALTGLGVGVSSAGLTMLLAAGGGCDDGGCMIPLVLGAFFGAVLLDETNNSFEFLSIEPSLLEDRGISPEEVEIYNAELTRANIIFDEVTSQLTDKSSIEDSVELWDEYKESLAPETFKVMQILASPTE